MKVQKSDILAFLRSDPVTPETRQKIYAEMMERVNAEYQSGPIDWPRLEAIEQRIQTAETFDELVLAVEVYELKIGIYL